MTKEIANPITGHSLVLMPPTTKQLEPFGWIELHNGSSQAGYIYLETQLKPSDPYLGEEGYIVTHMPMAALSVLLDILRNENNMQIRYYDTEMSGTVPSVFIEPKTKMGVPSELKKKLEDLQSQSTL